LVLFEPSQLWRVSNMKKFLVPAVTLAFLFLGAPGESQTPLPASPTVKLTAEQEHVIKEIVLKDFNFPKVAVKEFKVGDPAPADAQLQAFPEPVASKVSSVKSHKFFLAGDRIVIVDPKDNTVADVIQ
jgi:hypothetical protein